MRAEEVENKLHTTADIAASASVDDVKSGCGKGGDYTKSELLIGTLLVLLLSNVNPVITEWQNHRNSQNRHCKSYSYIADMYIKSMTFLPPSISFSSRQNRTRGVRSLFIPLYSEY